MSQIHLADVATGGKWEFSAGVDRLRTHTQKGRLLSPREKKNMCVNVQRRARFCCCRSLKPTRGQGLTTF